MAYNDNNPELDQGYDNSHKEDSNPTVSDNHILVQYSESQNIADDLPIEKLQDISGKCLAGIGEDMTTQAAWMKDVEDALKLSKLHREPKSTPRPMSANIKYPLIRNACDQFAARTYPELIQDGKIVKTEIAGPTNPMIDMIAYGVATHMSHQLLGADSCWEAGMDRLLNVLPNIGFVCKKTYYDSTEKQNISDVCYYKDLILRNDPSILSLSDLRRITHVLHVHPNDLVTMCRAGLYSEDVVEEILNLYSDGRINPECDLYECHTFIDLDDDGYEEPYIVTIHKNTNKILRLVARYDAQDIELNKDKKVLRIKPCQYFTDYHFLPSPDGSFMSAGFGTLMLHLNETINTLLNQLIDAGTLANLQTGIIDSRIKLMGGQMMVDPGQWTRAKAVIGQQLKDGIVPINYKEPSSVLYQLLGLLLQAGKELTSSTDAMQGLQNATNVPATSMLAMIEQGMKLYSAIQRRLYRSLKDEYQKIYKLNGKHLDEEDYITVLGPEYQALPNIYKTKAIKVIPIADPNLSSDAQRLSQAQVVMSVANLPNSLVTQYEAQKRMLEAAKVPNIDALIPKSAANQPKAPDPKMVDVQMKAKHNDQKIALQAQKQQLQQQEFAAKVAKMEAEITHLQASAVNLVAQAKSADHNTAVSDFNSKLGAIKTQMDAVAQQHQQMTDANIAHKELSIKQQQVDQQHQQAMTGLDQSQQGIDNAGQDQQGDAQSVDSTPDQSGDAPAG